MTAFALHGGSADVARAIKGSSRAQRAIELLMSRRGMGQKEAERVVSDMLVSGLSQMGGAFKRLKKAHIDKIVKLRSELASLQHELLHSTLGPKQLAEKIDGQMGRIKTLYKELDDAVASAALPVERMKLGTDEELAAAIRNVEPATPRQTWRPVEADVTPVAGQGKKTRFKVKGLIEITGEKGAYRVEFAGGHSAEFRIRNGRYEVTTSTGGRSQVFAEFDVAHDPYKALPKTTSVMNGHHGMQNSQMEKVFGRFGYKGDEAPTIWLRDGRRGSPHGTVTDVQNAFRRANPGTAGLTLGAIRDKCIAELKMIGMPEPKIHEYLNAFGEHFRQTVLPNMEKSLTSEQVGKLLGSWDLRR